MRLLPVIIECCQHVANEPCRNSQHVRISVSGELSFTSVLDRATTPHPVLGPVAPKPVVPVSGEWHYEPNERCLTRHYPATSRDDPEWTPRKGSRGRVHGSGLKLRSLSSQPRAWNGSMSCSANSSRAGPAESSCSTGIGRPSRPVRPMPSLRAGNLARRARTSQIVSTTPRLTC